LWGPRVGAPQCWARQMRLGLCVIKVEMGRTEEVEWAKEERNIPSLYSLFFFNLFCFLFCLQIQFKFKYSLNSQFNYNA
jgi:hypothetical protein